MQPTTDPTVNPTEFPTNPTSQPTLSPTVPAIENIIIVTDVTNPGNDSFLHITLNWADKQYLCSLKPNQESNKYSCNISSISMIKPNTVMPYFTKLEYSSSSPLQISMINVTSDDGSYYAINDYCIR